MTPETLSLGAIILLGGVLISLFIMLINDQRANRKLTEQEAVLTGTMQRIADRRDQLEADQLGTQLNADDVRAMREALTQLGIERNSAQTPYGHLSERGLTPSEETLDSRLHAWLADREVPDGQDA